MKRLSVAALALALVTGCESETTRPEELPSEGTLIVDATSGTEFVYVALEEGGTVVAVSDPSSAAWDLAFRRYTMRVNGGVAGGGRVAAATLGTHAGLSATEVAELTRADADAAFEAVTASNIPGVQFQEARLVEDAGRTWFQFNPMAGTIVGNPASVWRLREADGGGHTLLRVSGMDMGGVDLRDLLAVTIQYRRQAPGGTLGSLNTLTVPVAGQVAYVDLSSGSIVDGTGCDWDLRIDPEIHIEVNAACGAGTFPLGDSETFAGATHADNAPEYGGFLSIISGAIPNSIDDATGLFWYDIQGNNRLWPTYNVFLIEDGSDVYKLQVIDYYSATGTPGQLVLRFEQLR